MATFIWNLFRYFSSFFSSIYSPVFSRRFSLTIYVFFFPAQSKYSPLCIFNRWCSARSASTSTFALSLFLPTPAPSPEFFSVRILIFQFANIAYRMAVRVQCVSTAKRNVFGSSWMATARPDQAEFECCAMLVHGNILCRNTYIERYRIHRRQKSFIVNNFFRLFEVDGRVRCSRGSWIEKWNLWLCFRHFYLILFNSHLDRELKKLLVLPRLSVCSVLGAYRRFGYRWPIIDFSIHSNINFVDIYSGKCVPVHWHHSSLLLLLFAWEL